MVSVSEGNQCPSEDFEVTHDIVPDVPPRFFRGSVALVPVAFLLFGMYDLPDSPMYVAGGPQVGKSGRVPDIDLCMKRNACH